METVTDYYNEVLNITLTEFISPNVMKIAEKSDQCELGRLLQLILGIFPIQIIVFKKIYKILRISFFSGKKYLFHLVFFQL